MNVPVRLPLTGPWLLAPMEGVTDACFRDLVLARNAPEDLGGATLGSAGEPLLVMSGSLTTGSFIELDLYAANPLSLALVFVSFSSSPTAFLGR